MIEDILIEAPSDHDEEAMGEEPGDPEDHLICNMFDFDDIVSGFFLELRKK